MSGNDVLYGWTGDDVLYGWTGNDVLHGQSGADVLYGESDNDTMYVGDGNDQMVGGSGKDTMKGGAGYDVFDFNATSESGIYSTTRDVIGSFEFGWSSTTGDKIDVSTIDANALVSGNQAFHR